MVRIKYGWFDYGGAVCYGLIIVCIFMLHIASFLILQLRTHVRTLSRIFPRKRAGNNPKGEVSGGLLDNFYSYIHVYMTSYFKI